MKNWCYADIPNWQTYQPAFENFVLSRIENSAEMYNHVSKELLNQHCPALTEMLTSNFGQIERVIIFKMTESDLANKLENNFIHVDSGIQTARLNWPILNPNSVITKYFHVANIGYTPRRHYINPPYKDYIDIYDAAHCQEVDLVCVDRPVVFNVFKPHGMFANGNAWPRIMASINFQDNAVLEKYLQKDDENC